MKVLSTPLDGVLVIEPTVFGDERGFFMESFNRREFSEQAGIALDFVQDNHSRSARGVLRGLHYQIVQPQGKLVRVGSGAVFDVVVDMRRSSATFGRWHGVELSAANRRIVWVPPGFAHGFLTLSDTADFLYKTTDYYAPQHQRALLWNDPQIGIEWPLTGAPILSEKDRVADYLSTAESFD